MQKIFTRRGIVKPLLILGAASCAFLLLNKGAQLLHIQASDLLVQCSATAIGNTDKFAYSVLAGIASSKASDTQMMNPSVVLEQFSKALQSDFSANNAIDSCEVVALVYLKVYQ